MGRIDFAALQGVATRHIENFGRQAALRSDQGDLPVTAAILDYGATERDGELVLPNDRRAFVAATPGVPLPDPERHKLVIDGVPFRIVMVRPLNPSGVTLYFDCQVRR